MKLTDLWDSHVLIYAILSSLVVLFVLIVLVITTRRLRCVISELDSIRSELKLLEEGIRTVTQSLQSKASNLMPDKKKKNTNDED